MTWSILKTLINWLKGDKKSYKNIDIYCTGYITVKDSDCVNSLYLIINEVDRYIKEKNGSKYLVFESANENNEVLKKYNELWDGIKNEIETIKRPSNLILTIIYH